MRSCVVCYILITTFVVPLIVVDLRSDYDFDFVVTALPPTTYRDFPHTVICHLLRCDVARFATTRSFALSDYPDLLIPVVVACVPDLHCFPFYVTFVVRCEPRSDLFTTFDDVVTTSIYVYVSPIHLHLPLRVLTYREHLATAR